MIFLGIPLWQQHLIYKNAELKDSTEVKDLPLAQGSRLKLVLGRIGSFPVVAQRRFVTDFNSLFDLNTARSIFTINALLKSSMKN